MGFILSKFKTKQSVEEILAHIKQESADLEKSKAESQMQCQRFILRMTLYSVAIYFLFLGAIYFLSPPSTSWKQKAVFWGPVLLFPILIYYLRKFLHWYFVRNISNQELKLKELKNRKTKLLDEVMETESYKKATKILEEYGDKSPVKKTPEEAGAGVPHPSTPGLRQRVTRPVDGTPVPPQANTPSGAPYRGPMGTPLANTSMGRPRPMGQPMPPGPPLPRHVPPRERGVFDKLVDYIVDDGPQSRFALICKRCLSHNGMALKEEFEYLAFRCCYCFTLNESRKKRPDPPALPVPQQLPSAPEAPSGGDPADSGPPSGDHSESSPPVDSRELANGTESTDDEDRTSAGEDGAGVGGQVTSTTEELDSGQGDANGVSMATEDIKTSGKTIPVTANS